MGEKTALRWVAELWRRLLDAPGVSVERRDEYGARRVASPSNEELAWLVLSGGADAGPVGPIDVVLASYSAYHGSSLDRANLRVLSDEFGVGVCVGSGLDDHWQAVLPLGELPGSESSRTAEASDWVVEDGVGQLRELVEAMERLADYPLLDDEAHSALEVELADEAWSAWLWADLRAEISRRLTGSCPESVVSPSDGDITNGGLANGGLDEVDLDGCESRIREAYYGYEHNEWTCETACSAVNLRHDDAVDHILDQWETLTHRA